jgi:hypothetical protein
MATMTGKVEIAREIFNKLEPLFGAERTRAIMDEGKSDFALKIAREIIDTKSDVLSYMESLKKEFLDLREMIIGLEEGIEKLKDYEHLNADEKSELDAAMAAYGGTDVKSLMGIWDFDHETFCLDLEYIIQKLELIEPGIVEKIRKDNGIYDEKTWF